MLNITHCSLFTVCSGKFISSLEALHVLVNCTIIFWRLLCWASIWNVRLWVLGVQRVKTVRKPNNFDPSQPYPVKNEYFLDHTDLKFFTWQFLNWLIPHTRENYFHIITVPDRVITISGYLMTSPIWMSLWDLEETHSLLYSSPSDFVPKPYPMKPCKITEDKQLHTTSK